MSTKKFSESALSCVQDLCRLRSIDLDGVWDLSESFLSATTSVDDVAYSPLDAVVWDKDSGRYQYNNKEEENTVDLKQDDFILQAMVMWNLERLNQGWGREKMLRQLSVWQNAKKPSESSLPNLWAAEITKLQAEKKLGKALNHHDNFDTWRCFYAGTKNRTDRWARRSNTTFNYSNILAEQAAVQWALETAAKNDSYLAELAVVVIRMNYRGSTPFDTMWLAKILCEQAAKTKGGDEAFSKNSLLAIEEYQAASASAMTTAATTAAATATPKEKPTKPAASSSTTKKRKRTITP